MAAHVFLLMVLLVAATSGEDRLQAFYDRIKKDDVVYCKDKTMLLPACTECIPGLKKDASGSCKDYIPDSHAIREEIRGLTLQRYGDKMVPNRPFGLYPYLEKPDFMQRQLTFGKLLSTKPITNLIDIGAYYNPINLFMAADICPETVIIVEPILDALSVMVPCIDVHADKKTHIMFLPITFKHYMTISSTLPVTETVVCIGCDSHYGPNRKMLETAFHRPYSLFIEYPSEYIHNGPFKKMIGDGPGEEMTFIHKFQPKTNETQYTKRVMKVIEYKPV